MYGVFRCHSNGKIDVAIKRTGMPEGVLRFTKPFSKPIVVYYFASTGQYTFFRRTHSPKLPVLEYEFPIGGILYFKDVRYLCIGYSVASAIGLRYPVFIEFEEVI